MLFENPYMTSYLTSMDTISLSCTVFEIFDFKVFQEFDLDLWPLKVIWGRKNFILHSKGHIWLPIWLLWTPSLYLVPFSRYSIFKVFMDLTFTLRSLKVIWGQKNLYYSKDHIWLPIWLLWTPSFYLVPFSRYSTSTYFRVWPWPLTPKGHMGSKKCVYYSKGHVWLPIWLLWTPSLYLVPFSRYSTSKFFRVWPWPLTPEDHLGSRKFILFENPYMTSYLTSMDTISLSRTVFEIFDFKVF